MRTFVPEGAAYVARLEAPERAVLLDVVDDVLGLVGARTAQRTRGREEDPLGAVQMATVPLPEPTDPALLRLLPSASPDADVAAEFRRLTEVDLRRAKSDQLLRLRACVDAAGPDLVVVPSEAARIAAALTDVRLVTSERLGVRNDRDADALYRLVLEGTTDDEHPAHGDDVDEGREQAHRLLATVYVMLSLLQESLVGLMLAGLPDEQPDADDGGGGTDAHDQGDGDDSPGATGATEPPAPRR